MASRQHSSQLFCYRPRRVTPLSPLKNMPWRIRAGELIGFWAATDLLPASWTGAQPGQEAAGGCTGAAPAVSRPADGSRDTAEIGSRGIEGTFWRPVGFMVDQWRPAAVARRRHGSRRSSQRWSDSSARIRRRRDPSSCSPRVDPLRSPRSRSRRIIWWPGTGLSQSRRAEHSEVSSEVQWRNGDPVEVRSLCP